MHGFKGSISKFLSDRVQKILLVLAAVLIASLFICSWPQRFLFLRQYLPAEISLKWFMSFSSLNVVTNIELAKYHNSLAGIFIQQGKYAQAITEYDKAVEMENASITPYYNRGCLYLKLGRFDLVAQDFNEVIKMDPEFVAAYDNLGFIDANQGRFDRAMFAFTKALEIDPNYASAKHNREILYGRLKRH